MSRVRLFAERCRSEDAQTMAEYGLVLAVITIAILGAMTALSGGITGTLGRVTSLLP